MHIITFSVASHLYFIHPPLQPRIFFSTEYWAYFSCMYCRCQMAVQCVWVPQPSSPAYLWALLKKMNTPVVLVCVCVCVCVCGGCAASHRKFNKPSKISIDRRGIPMHEYHDNHNMFRLEYSIKEGFWHSTSSLWRGPHETINIWMDNQLGVQLCHNKQTWNEDDCWESTMYSLTTLYWSTLWLYYMCQLLCLTARLLCEHRNLAETK